MSDTDFFRAIKKMTENNKIILEIFEIVKYDYANKVIEIKRPFEKTTFDNVMISSVGLGNNCGVAVGYQVGDTVLVYDFNGQYIIVSSLHNIFFPGVKDTEIWPKPKEIIIQSNALSKVRLKSDGGFQLFNKENYGIECSATGEVNIRCKTKIKHTQTPGDFND